jgi:hypothetical protein
MASVHAAKRETTVANQQSFQFDYVVSMWNRTEVCVLSSIFFSVLISYADSIATDQPDAACLEVLDRVNGRTFLRQAGCIGVNFGDLKDHNARIYLDN